MAAPIIDSVAPAGPLVLQPGQSIEFTVTAHDPDNMGGTVTFNVSDQAGNVTQATVSLSLTDTLTYSAESTIGTIVNDPDDGPNVFVLSV